MWNAAATSSTLTAPRASIRPVIEKRPVTDDRRTNLPAAEVFFAFWPIRRSIDLFYGQYVGGRLWLQVTGHAALDAAMRVQ
jgi:hypothetical protein